MARAYAPHLRAVLRSWLVEPLALRAAIYRHFVEAGTAPSRAEIADMVGDAHLADDLLRALHEGHMIVLDDRPHRVGEIRMALPFSAEPTDFRVTTASGAWWANCAWDSLAVLAALHEDGRIEAHWSDTGEPIRLGISDGALTATDGYIHFRIPASQWWDDIVRT
jgi:hypothetical protein